MPASDPLPQSAVYVLIAIGPKELHGYAIMSEIARITDGSVRLGPGTLYTSIKRLLVKHRYPPDKQPDAIRLVIEQMESMAPRLVA